MAAELGLVPVREMDLSLEFGATCLDAPVTEVFRHFDRPWLCDYTDAAPEHLLFISGIGDAMTPTIHDSDLLLVDCSQQRLTMTDKIWAVVYDSCGAVKRLRPRADGGVEMISDNLSVPNQIAHDCEMHL